MSFDIHALDNFEFDQSPEAEEALEEYQDALLNRFLDSPECQEYLTIYPEVGFWTDQLIYLGILDAGVPLTRMTASHAATVVRHLIPENLSGFLPEELESAIPELIAFWKFLKREYHLPSGEAIIQYLEEIQPQFGKNSTVSAFSTGADRLAQKATSKNKKKPTGKYRK